MYGTGRYMIMTITGLIPTVLLTDLQFHSGWTVCTAAGRPWHWRISGKDGTTGWCAILSERKMISRHTLDAMKEWSSDHSTRRMTAAVFRVVSVHRGKAPICRAATARASARQIVTQNRTETWKIFYLWCHVLTTIRALPLQLQFRPASARQTTAALQYRFDVLLEVRLSDRSGIFTGPVPTA